jgi:hypothetical protein
MKWCCAKNCFELTGFSDENAFFVCKLGSDKMAPKALWKSSLHFYLHLQDVGNRVTLMTSCDTFYALTRRLRNDGDFDFGMTWNPIWNPIWDPNLGPHLGTPFGDPIWDPNLDPHYGPPMQYGPPIWTLYMNPNMDPQYKPPIWTPNMDPQYGPPIWTPNMDYGPPIWTPILDLIRDPYLGPRFGPLICTPNMDYTFNSTIAKKLWWAKLC